MKMRRRGSMPRRGGCHTCKTCGPAGRRWPKPRDRRDPLELDMPERRVVLDEQGRIAEIACANGSMRTAWSRIS
jgi:hypothetical protein